MVWTLLTSKFPNWTEHDILPDGTVDFGNVTHMVLDETQPNFEVPSGSDGDDPRIPGAWHKAQKRKRVERSASNTSLVVTSEWTKREWKRLEKVLVSEQTKFITERDAPPPQAGWSPWSRKKPTKVWDRSRVVDAFLRGIPEVPDSDDWSR